MAQYKSKIGKDVLAFCDTAYMKTKPIQGPNGVTGSYVVFVLSIDVAGSLPDFVKKAIGDEQAKSCDKTCEYIKANFKGK